MNKNELKFFLKYWLPVGLWMGVIFALSAMKGHPHQGVVGWQFYAERKGAHITEYFILTLLLFRAFWQLSKNVIKITFSVTIIALLWAMSDEFHQLFVFGREGKISDVGIDFIGIFLAITAILYLLKRKREK